MKSRRVTREQRDELAGVFSAGCGDNACWFKRPDVDSIGTDSRCRCLSVYPEERRRILRERVLGLIDDLNDADPRRGPCGYSYHTDDCDCDGMGGGR